jgi:glycosyltransferase involved in cell wall biosynthesis
MTSVMHVLAPGAVGGLERVVQALAIAQRAHRRLDAVHVATLSTAPVRKLEPFFGPLEDAGVHVHTIVTPPRSYARQRAELVALAEQLTPGIVHSHGAHADVLAVKLGESVGAATVTTLHGMTGGDLRNRFYEWAQLRSCRVRDAIVAVSRPLANALLRSDFAPERTHVVRNTWCPGTTAPITRRAAREALGLPQSAFVIGWVGRVSHEKGLDVLLAALSQSPTPDVHLAVLGEGRERPKLAARAATTEFARQGRMHWLGLVPDASRLLAAFNVVVVSSRTEGTPMLLLEAMAAGVPIISTRVGGIPDVLSPAEALLVPSEHPTALAAAIDQVHRDPTAARRRAIAASQRLAREHDVDTWTEQYDSVYEAALATAAFRRPLVVPAPTDAAPIPPSMARPVSVRRDAQASPAPSAP